MAQRKVIDIFPPGEKKNEEIKIPETKKEKPRLTKEPAVLIEERIIKPVFGHKRSFSFRKYQFILTAIFLVALFTVGFFTLSKAEIAIWPKTENLSFSTTFTVDANATTSNFSARVISGQLFQKDKTITQNFVASGRILKEEKAKGLIKVYNAYSTSPQSLVVNTRFVSSDGKLFRSNKKITVPGGSYSGGKLVPGEVEVEVTADQAGPEYNINPTTFSIPGFAGTDKYTKFYAKSSAAFTGGFSQQVSQVVKEDLTQAKDSLSREAKDQCESDFVQALRSAEISPEYLYSEKAIQTEVLETFTLAKAGDDVDNFNYQVKAESKTLIFPRKNFEDFVQQLLLSRIPEGKTAYQESLNVDIVTQTVNLASKKIVFSLTVSVKTYDQIDLAEFKASLENKTLEETKSFLASQSWMDRSEAKLWPFWVKKVPKNADKIELELNID